MLANVGWKWRGEQSQHATGSSMSKSSPREAFAERGHVPPHNSMECGLSPSKELGFNHLDPTGRDRGGAPAIWGAAAPASTCSTRTRGTRSQQSAVHAATVRISPAYPA